MSKYDFNKVVKQLYRNCTSAWVFSCEFAAYFQNTFPKNTSGQLLATKGCLSFSTIGPRPLSSALVPRPRKYYKNKFMNKAC